MAGRGPAPKDPDRRARRNPDPVALRVVHTEPVSQPDLPTFEVERDGELVEWAWPARTQEWWRTWGEHPISATFTTLDWSELLDTALLHARLWSGNLNVAGELRLRVAKFGATPEDRARLRITFAQADEAEGKTSRSDRGPSARERRGRYTGGESADAG